MKMKRAAWKVLFTIVLASAMAIGGMQAQTHSSQDRRDM